MSWQTTLVQPVHPDRQTLVEVTCQWCPWTAGLFDATTDEGRAAVRGARVGHTCEATPAAPERS